MILELKHAALAWKTAMVNRLGATLFFSCGVTIQNYMEYQCTETPTTSISTS